MQGNALATALGGLIDTYEWMRKDFLSTHPSGMQSNNGESARFHGARSFRHDGSKAFQLHVIEELTLPV